MINSRYIYYHLHLPHKPPHKLTFSNWWFIIAKRDDEVGSGMGGKKICENFRNIYRSEWGEFISIQPQRLSVFPSINYSIQTLWRVKSNRNVVQIRKILETPPHHPTLDLWHHNSSQSSAAKQKAKNQQVQSALLADLCDHRNHLINFQECCSVARSRHHRVARVSPPAAKTSRKISESWLQNDFWKIERWKSCFLFSTAACTPTAAVCMLAWCSATHRNLPLSRYAANQHSLHRARREKSRIIARRN